MMSRNLSLHRQRWQSDYLLNRASNEGSFVAEYRVDPRGFDELIEMLTPSLQVNQKFANIAMAKTNSKPITVASRVGAALIMLGGGRRIEAMRTHGISESLA